MADTLQNIFNALSQVFEPDFHRQWNRTTVLLGMLSAKAGRITEGAGKNVAFDVEFSGATASTVAEGQDVAPGDYTVDSDVPVFMPWCTYRSNFQVTEREIDAARSSNGTPEELRDIFGARIFSAGSTIISQIENDALVGTGVDGSGNPTLVGVYGGALAASGVYGGVSAVTFSEWASNIVSNGGTPRALTPDLIEQADQNIFTASSKPWDLAMTSAGVVRKYAGMFMTGPGTTNLPLVRMNDNAGRPVYGIGPAPDAQNQADQLYMKGRRVYRNRLNPTGKLALLNTDDVKIKYLPRILSNADRDFMQMMGLQGSGGSGGTVQATSLPMRLTYMAKTGDSIKVSANVTLAMAVTRRNSQALITDINET